MNYCRLKAAFIPGPGLPQVEFVPVWIENLGRVMPKGAFIPVPLLCTLILAKRYEFMKTDPARIFSCAAAPHY